MYGDDGSRPPKLKSRRLSEVKPSKQSRDDSIDPIFERAIFSEGDDEESEFIRRHTRRKVQPDFTDDTPAPTKRRPRKISSTSLSAEDKPEDERAHDAALRILSYGANTRSRLIMKLTDRGFSEEAAVLACDRLEAEGILSDKREIDGAVMALSKRYGPDRIPMELRKLGFESELIRSVDYELLGVNFTSVIRRIIDAKGYDEKTRAYLRSRGFSDRLIREAQNSEDE